MKTATIAVLAAALGAVPPAAGAQSAPPAPQPPVTIQSPTPMNSSLPAPVSSSEPASAASGSGTGSGSGTSSGSGTGSPSMTTPKPETSPSGAGGTGSVRRVSPIGKHLDGVKRVPSGTLAFSDLRYALTHPLQEAKKVQPMKSVGFDKLRVYRLPTTLKSILKLGALGRDTAILAELSPAYEVAQTNGSNSPIAYLQSVLANINVSNALNNVSLLNGANVNVGVTLQDVLNGNKISIGSVAGIFVNSLGIITTITK